MKSLQPNDAERWYPSWDNASNLNFAIRDGFQALIDGQAIKDIVDGERKLTHAQRRFLRHALEELEELQEAAGSAAGVDFELGSDVQRPATVDGMEGEIKVFGRHLRSSDGSVHEVVRLRLKELRADRFQADHDWTAIAAVSVAYMRGVPADARIRVSEFSLADGQYRCNFDGSRQQILDLPGIAQAMPEALSGQAFRPGQACASCAFLNVCPAVPRRRGVLGLPDRAVATRHLTSADLHAYDRCPTAFLAQRRDYLPDAYHDFSDFGGGTVARDRGMAVHAWLKWAHSREPGQGCEPADLPDPLSDGGAGAAALAGLTVESYQLAFPFLQQHIDHCMRGLEGLGGWQMERRVVVFDPDADVVVISTPDSICSVADTGEPIWREVKTTGSVPPSIEAALQLYPAFALNIALLAAEVEHGQNAFAELEVLTSDNSVVFHADLQDGALVAEAQRLVADIGRRFAGDLEFDRQPSGACANCSVHRWCDPPEGAQIGAAPVVDDNEFLSEPDPF